MKHFKLFFALFAMLALGVGNAWGADFTLTSANSVTVDGVTITFAKGSGSTAPTWYAAGLRLYAQNTVTITSESEITSIVFDWEKQGSKTFASVSANTGSYSHPSAAGKGTWTGSSKSVIFTLASTSGVQLQLNTLSVTTANGGGDEPPTPPTTYTIKWHTAVGTTTDVTLNEGATITKPATDPTMTGYEFMGWTDQCNVATDGAGFTPLTNFGTADSDKDFYAVFAEATTTSGGGSSNYEKVTSNLADWAGDYLIAYNATTFADGRTGGTDGMGAQNKKVDLSSNISNNAIPANVGDQYNVTLEAVSGGYVLKTKDGKYNYQSGNANGLATTTTIATAAKYAINVTFTSENDIKLALTGDAAGAVFRYNTQGYFRFYKNGGQSAVYLYKKTSGGGSTTTHDNYITTCSGSTPVETLTDAQFAWSAATAEATMDASNTFPTLTNTLSVPVTYESSTPATATIDASTGAITLVAPGTTTISATFAGGEVSGTTYAAKTVSYTLIVKKAPLTPIAGGVIDILNQAWTGKTNSTYGDVAEKTAENKGHSNAKYVAQCAGDKSSIQLRSNNSNSGVVSTVSGGVVKRIEVEWHADTDAARTLQIYGSNTAYTAATDLYGDAKGELLGELNKGEGETTLDFSEWTGDYKYIGFRSKSGAMYLTTVTITWLPVEGAVTAPTISGDAEFVESTEVTISAEEGLKVYYTLDGTDPTNASTEYTAPFELTATTTVKAVAYDGEKASDIVSKTFKKLQVLTCAEANKLTDAATCVLKEFTVTYIYKLYIHIQDASGYGMIYKSNFGLNVGDVVTGFTCSKSTYNGLPQFVPTCTLADVTVVDGEAPAVVELTTAPTGNYHQVVKLMNLQMTGSFNTSSNTTVEATCPDGTTINIFNGKNHDYTFVAGKTYNITGDVCQYSGKIQVSTYAIEEYVAPAVPDTPTSVDNVEATVAPVKVIENGQLIVIKNGVKYNALGQEIK